MLGKYAAAYVMIIETIDHIIGNLSELAKATPPKPEEKSALLALALMGKQAGAPLPASAGKTVIEVIQLITDQLNQHAQFPSVVAQNKRIARAVENNKGPDEVATLVGELRTRLIDELNEREFLYVPPARVEYYKNPMLMGKAVNDQFPAAIDDIEAAGKCLALGQGTACVLHTMRVMDVGLKTLAKSLGIPYAPSWESYLDQISKKIGEKHKNKTKKWKRDEKFYRDLSRDLLVVKQVWRNPTMHVDRKYDPDEAQEIFLASKRFITRMAEHFSEKELQRLLR